MSCNLLSLSTELLIDIFAYLPVTDMFSIGATCRRTYHIVAETAHLQYIVHTQLNGVDDLLPPDVSFSERLELLRYHEKAWNDLQFNLHSQFPVNMNYYTRKTILQDGYLIDRSVIDLTQYEYVDLFSLPPPQNEEPRWVHISLNNFSLPYALAFFVDHDLVVAIREKGTFNGLVLPQLAFFEFTTGEPHPLSSTHTVDVPRVDYFGAVKVEVEVVGDHILAKAAHRDGHSSFYLISWKVGTVTFLRALPGSPSFTVISSDLVLLIRESINCLEIYKLELASSQPRMRGVRVLELPPLIPEARIFEYMFAKEWIPSPEHRARSRFSQKRHLPLRSSRNDIIALLLSYYDPEGDLQLFEYAVFISVTALLSVARSGVRKVSWEKWGPLGTRIFPYLRAHGVKPMPAGPFWITGLSPLVVEDYDPLRVAHVRLTEDDPSLPSRHPIFAPTKLINECWVSGQVETHVPYRKLISREIDIPILAEIVGDREWVVVISGTSEKISYSVYHVG